MARVFQMSIVPTVIVCIQMISNYLKGTINSEKDKHVLMLNFNVALKKSLKRCERNLDFFQCLNLPN